MALGVIALGCSGKSGTATVLLPILTLNSLSTVACTGTTSAGWGCSATANITTQNVKTAIPPTATSPKIVIAWTDSFGGAAITGSVAFTNDGPYQVLAVGSALAGNRCTPGSDAVSNAATMSVSEITGGGTAMFGTTSFSATVSRSCS